MPPIRIIRLIKNVNREQHHSYFLQPIVQANFTARARSSPPVPYGLGLQSLTLHGDEFGGNREIGLDHDPSPKNEDVTDPYLLTAPVLSGNLRDVTRGKWTPNVHADAGAVCRFNCPLDLNGRYLTAIAARVVLTRPCLFITVGPTTGFPRLVLPPGAAPAPEPTPLGFASPLDPTAPPRPPDLWKPGDPYDGHLVDWMAADGTSGQCPVGYYPRFANPLFASTSTFIGCGKSYSAS